MPLGGFFVYQQKLNFYILVFWGLLGTILGSLPWYYLGRLVNEKKLSNFLDKQGKYLGISSNDLSKSKRWFDKYGVSLVFWGRLVPGIRTLISVPAGIELMPLRKFLEILQKVPGYSIDIFLKRVPRLINEPYTKEMGMKIAKKVTEKGVVRLVKIAAGANI